MTDTANIAADKTPRAGLNTLIILFGMAAVFAVLVPFVPAGYFEAGAPMALNRFHYSDTPSAMSLFASGDGVGFLNFLFEGFTSGSRTSAAVGVIAFILIVGGAFGVINATGAVDRGFIRLAAKTSHRPGWLLGGFFLAFSLGGAVFGMGEETIAFLALLSPLVDRLGLPRASAVMCTYMASQIGFGTSWMNPFSVVVAQGIVGLPVLSGAGLRVVMWASFTAFGIFFTLRYAAKHRRLPTEATLINADETPMNWADRAILFAVLGNVVWIVWGVTTAGYYIPQIATQFFTLGLVVGLIAVIDKRMDLNRVAETFIEGVRQLVPVALAIACAKGMLWLLGGADPHKASVLNTVLYGLGTSLEGLPQLVSAQGMLLTQAGFNFFVTSGSAQAAITMPLMAGLGELVGVTKQVSVLAFQLGDGVTNLIVPTSAVLMGAIGVAGLSWSEWLRAIWKFELGLLCLASAFVTYAVLTGYA
jgi:uncharacterized ion transporter superfamily protein YfcC